MNVSDTTERRTLNRISDGTNRVSAQNLTTLNSVCFTTCIVCVIIGAVLSLAMIWGELTDSAFVWKSWLTIGVFFFSSATTLVVSKALGRGD